MNIRVSPIGFLALTLAFITACHDENTPAVIVPEPDTYNPVLDPNLTTPDWTETTHGKSANPNYAIVFPQHQVNTLEISMTEYDWSFVVANMKNNGYGDFGESWQRPGDFGKDPAYIMTSVRFNGLQWYKVGFRLKGNSTLNVAWESGIYKLPFRLDFDEFEEVYPQIKNQHFYGFNELSFSPGANDNSLLREKICGDLFREGGVPSAMTAFYKMYINFGKGPKYCGIYTMVEVVDDTMIKTQFGNDDGNIYKPTSYLTTFAERDFEKKNNKTAADYTDVKTFIENLNSPLRISNPIEWRTKLEQSFNVDHFIRWLAINNTMQNWDTYGRLAHNYYLYHHPQHNLIWIPWDNNESLSDRNHGSGHFSMPEVSATRWPLTRYIIDDPVYNQKYHDHIAAFAENVFISDELNARFDYYHNLISPYIIGPENTEVTPYTHLISSDDFANGLLHLKQHVANRLEAVDTYLQ
jgi:spore coat protein H